MAHICVFEGFWDIQPSLNLFSSSRPPYETFKNLGNQFRRILGYPALLESLPFVRRSKFVQNSLKIGPRSPKNAPKRPKASNMGLT